METENVKASRRSKAVRETSWTDLAMSWGTIAAQAAFSGALFSIGGLMVNRILGDAQAVPAIGSEDVVVQLPTRRAGNS